jgi:hypothetical protein
VGERSVVMCACGGKLTAVSNPPRAAQDVVRVFREMHSGEGHREVDAAEYKRVMARLRRGEAKQIEALNGG